MNAHPKAEKINHGWTQISTDEGKELDANFANFRE